MGRPVSVEELIGVAEECDLDVPELEKLMGASLGEMVRDAWWPHPDVAIHDVQSRLRIQARERGELPPAPAPSRPSRDRRRRGRSHVGETAAACATEEGARKFVATLEEEESYRAVNRLDVTPKRMQQFVHENKTGRCNYRMKVRRRWGRPLPLRPHHVRNGITRHDVKGWLRAGWRTDNADAMDRELVRRCRRAYADDEGRPSRKKFRSLFGPLSLIYVLWHLARATERRGNWAGVVSGIPRGELARVLPNMGYCDPDDDRDAGGVHPDTISRWLRTVRAILGDLIDWHQPSSDAAEHYDVPGSQQTLSDGTVIYQAYNIYWFRGAEWLAKNAPSPPSLPAGRAVDLKQDYVTGYTECGLRSSNQPSQAQRQRFEARAGPATEPAGFRPPARSQLQGPLASDAPGEAGEGRVADPPLLAGGASAPPPDDAGGPPRGGTPAARGDAAPRET